MVFDSFIDIVCIFFLRLQKLTEELSIHRILNVKNDHYKVQYRNTDGQNVLTIGKKEFVHAEHQTKFKESWVSHTSTGNNNKIDSRAYIYTWIISISPVATIRLWTEAIEGNFSGVSDYIPAIVSVRGRTIPAMRLYANTLSSMVWSYSHESGRQKSHNRQHIFIIQLQYHRWWHLYGWSQGNKFAFWFVHISVRLLN